MRKKTFTQMLSLSLAAAVFFLTLPAQGWAMYVPASREADARQAELGAIRKTLESGVVKQRLMDFGLSSEESMARINLLSDEQTHRLATNLDSLQAGADGGVDSLVFLVLVAIIVVIVLQATGHSVIFR